MGLQEGFRIVQGVLERFREVPDCFKDVPRTSQFFMCKLPGFAGNSGLLQGFSGSPRGVLGNIYGAPGMFQGVAAGIRRFQERSRDFRDFRGVSGSFRKVTGAI